MKKLFLFISLVAVFFALASPQAKADTELSDGYYYIKNANPNITVAKVIAEGENNALTPIDCPADGNIDYTAIWKVTKADDGTYTIQNVRTGNYITAQTTKHAVYTTGSESHGFTIAYKFTKDEVDYYRIWNSSDWSTNTSTYGLIIPTDSSSVKAFRGTSEDNTSLTQREWSFVALSLTETQISAIYKAPTDGYYYLKSGNPNIKIGKVIGENKDNSLSPIDEPADSTLYWGAIWKVTNTGDGSFSIQNLKTGNYITEQTTKNAVYTTGSESHGFTIAYKFTISDVDYFRIWNSSDWSTNTSTYGLVIPSDSSGVKAFRGTSEDNTSPTQREWTLVPLSLTEAQITAGTAPLTGLSGIYRITSAAEANAVLRETVDTLVSCVTTSGSDTDLPELWRITESDNGTYTIQNVATDRYIDNSAKTKVQYSTITSASTFYIEGNSWNTNTGTAYVNIWKNSGKNYDIINDSSNDKAIAKGISSVSGLVGQGEWVLTPVTIDEATITTEKKYLDLSGVVQIKSALHQDTTYYYIQEISSNTLRRAGNVADGDCTARWILTRTDFGKYTIQNVTTGNYLRLTESNKEATTSSTAQALAIKYLYDNSDTPYFSIRYSSTSSYGLDVNTGQKKVFSWSGSSGTASNPTGYDFTFISTPMTEDSILAVRSSYYGYSSSVDSGKVYRIYNSTRNHYLTVNGYGSSCVLRHNSKQTTNYLPYAQYWIATPVDTVTVDGENIIGYTFQNVYTQKYWSSKSQSPYTVADEGSTFYVVANEVVPLMPYFNIKQSTTATSVPHAQESGSTVVNWAMGTTAVTASEWLFEEVTDLTDAKIAAAQADYAEKLKIISNASTYGTTLSKYFSDKACTTLNEAYTSDNITEKNLQAALEADDLPSDLQTMVLKIYNNSWSDYEKEFRIAEYEAYSNPSYWSFTGLGFSYQMCHIESPTGIYAKKGDFLYIFVGEDAIPENKVLYLENVASGVVDGTKTKLSVGTNVICADQTGSLFINYHDTATTNIPALSSANNRTIHIEGGTLNGYIDVREETSDGHRGHTNDDFVAMKKAGLFSAPLLDMRNRNLVYHMDATAVLNAFKEDSTYWGSNKVVETLGVWDKILDEEDSICGINDDYIDGYSTHCNNIWSVCSPGSSYMHATTYGTYYNTSTMIIMQYRYMKTNGGQLWGPAHENGHCHQNLINIIGDTEVSNNLFSNACVWLRGYTTTRGEDLDATFANYADGNFYLDYAERLRMYWQLYLYYEVLGKHPNFFPELFASLRRDRMVRTTSRVVKGSENYLKFARKCCEVSGDDLTEFFKVWGFFVPITNKSVDDYGNYTLTTTQDEINETLEYMATFNKGAENIIFIEDRITAPAAQYLAAAEGKTVRTSYSTQWTIGSARGDVGQFTDYDESANTKASGYLYSVIGDGSSITVKTDKSAGTGAVGFKIYDASGNLVALSNNDTISIPSSIVGTNYTVYAAQADGTLVEIPNSSSTYYTLTAYYGTSDRKTINFTSAVPETRTGNTVFVLTNTEAPTTIRETAQVVYAPTDSTATATSFALADTVGFYTPCDFTATKLTYSRKNTAGYNSVCLPFATTSSDFGTDATIYSTGSTTTEDGTTYVYITPQDEAAAGTPVLVNCPDDVTTWSIEKKNVAVVKYSVQNAGSATTLIGSFRKNVIGAGYYKLNSTGTAFGITTDAGKVYPFRAYMKVNDSSNDSSNASRNASRLVVRLGDATTGIESVNADASAADAWYDLQGRRVLCPAKGIYIHNGRKVIVR